MNIKQTEPRMSTYLHAVGARKGLPIAGNFELTARCNFSCPMCYVHQAQPDMAKELTAEQWISLARQARDSGMVFALLTGGEPFIRKDFFEIFKGMQQMGLMVSINSNGSMLNGEVRQRLLENPPTRINISLYGGMADTYRAMCGRNCFDSVVENIRAIKQAGVDVRLNVSITPWNCRDIEAIYEISQRLDVPMKASTYMYPPVRLPDGSRQNRLSPWDAAKYSVAWDALRLTPEEFAQRAQSIMRLCAVEQEGCSADLEEGVSCRAGTTSFWLTWDGRMLPCGMMPGPEVYPLEEGFEQAWKTLRIKTKEITGAAQCQQCPQRELCGACAAVRVTETGRFDGVPEYMCQMTQYVIEETCRTWQERNGEANGN